MFDKNNSIAKYIFILGLVVIVIGIIGSFICGKVFSIETEHGYYYTYYTDEYNWAIALFGSLGSVLVGSIYIALSEIIERLTIKRTYKIEENLEEIHKLIKGERAEIKSIKEDLNKIYSSKNEAENGNAEK